MNDDLLTRAHKALKWLVPDAEHRSDECRGNIDEGSQGGHSEDLIAARAVLDELDAANE